MHTMNFCLLRWERDSQALHLQLSGRLGCLWYFRGPESVPWFTVEQKTALIPVPFHYPCWEAGSSVCTGSTALVTSFLPPESLLYWEISSEFRFKIHVTNLCHSWESVNIHSENLLYSSTGLIAFMSELLETKILGQPQISHSNEMFPV